MTRVRVALSALVVGVVALISVQSASAAGLSTRGIDASAASSIGCMSPALCVVGAEVGPLLAGHSAIVLVRNDRPSRPIVLRNTIGAFGVSVSCPNAAGCVAVAANADDLEVELVTITRAGRVRTRLLPSSHDAVFRQIACTSLSSCELAGGEHGTTRLAVASYNGRSVRVSTLSAPVAGQLSGISGIACSGPTCVMSGNAGPNSNLGWFVTISGGRVTGEHRLIGSGGIPASVYAVACATSKLCFVTTQSSGASILPIVDGQLESPIQDNVPLLGLACLPTSCMGVGPAGGFGVYVPFSLTTAPTYQQDFSTGEFTGVALSSGGFVAALGPNLNGGPAVTTN